MALGDGNRNQDKPSVTGARCTSCHATAYRKMTGKWFHAYRSDCGAGNEMLGYFVPKKGERRDADIKATRGEAGARAGDVA